MISIVACVYLMFKLPRVTWERFGLWLLAGVVIYFLYSMMHSRLRLKDGAKR
jgi:APA family basic amino acid/polyamine antiporter